MPPGKSIGPAESRSAVTRGSLRAADQGAEMVGAEGLGSQAHQAKRPPQGQGRRRSEARGYSAPHVDRRNGVQLVDEEGCRVARIRRSQGSRDTAGKVVPA